jgi:hypothetical protein
MGEWRVLEQLSTEALFLARGLEIGGEPSVFGAELVQVDRPFLADHLQHAGQLGEVVVHKDPTIGGVDDRRGEGVPSG